MSEQRSGISNTNLERAQRRTRAIGVCILLVNTVTVVLPAFRRVAAAAVLLSIPQTIDRAQQRHGQPEEDRENGRISSRAEGNGSHVIRVSDVSTLKIQNSVPQVKAEHTHSAHSSGPAC